MLLPAYRWALKSPSALLWREWDGEIALYDGTNGNTHLIGDWAVPVFLELSQKADGLTVEEIGQIAYCVAQDSPEWQETDDAILRVLHEFEANGLVEKKSLDR